MRTTVSTFECGPDFNVKGYRRHVDLLRQLLTQAFEQCGEANEIGLHYYFIVDGPFSEARSKKPIVDRVLRVSRAKSDLFVEIGISSSTIGLTEDSFREVLHRILLESIGDVERYVLTRKLSFDLAFYKQRMAQVLLVYRAAPLEPMRMAVDLKRFASQCFKKISLD